MTERPMCQGCDYAEALREPLTFRCRRHAPRPSSGTSEGIVWPLVSHNDWCGEYLPKGMLHESEDPLSSFRRGGGSADDDTL